eukprot:161468-Chlamydomonas_euryale.AAC.1
MQESSPGQRAGVHHGKACWCPPLRVQVSTCREGGHHLKAAHSKQVTQGPRTATPGPRTATP